MDKSLDCEEVIARLFDYLDREMDDDTWEAIDRHVALCRSCFTRAEFERRLRARLAETGESEAPESLRAKTRQLLERL